MLLSGFAISALSKDLQLVLLHQDFLVPIFVNTFLSKECHEQAASDCLSILTSLCSHNPGHFKKLVQERRLVPRLLELLEPSLGLRLSTSGDRLAKLQEQVLTLLAQFCEHPVVGLKTKEKLMANLQLIVQKVNMLSLKVTLLTIQLLRVLADSLKIFSDFLEMNDLHREMVSLAIMAFNNLHRGRLEMDGVQMEDLLASSLFLIGQFCQDPELGDRLIAHQIELIDRTDGHFLPLAILRHSRESEQSAIALIAAIYILYYAASSPFFQLSLSRKDLELLHELRRYEGLAPVTSAIIELFN